MPRNDWHKTVVPRRVKQLWAEAHQDLSAINSQCIDVDQLVSSEAMHIARWITAVWASDSGGRQATQLLTRPPAGCGQFPALLGSILGRLLSGSPCLLLDVTDNYYDCMLAVTHALDRILLLLGAINTLTPVSTTVGLSVSKQIQQAELLDPLLDSLKQLTGTINTQLALVTSSACSDVDPPCSSSSAQDSHASHASHTSFSWNRANELSKALLFVTMRIGIMWPGGIYTSAPAGQLMPAAVRLLAAYAQMASNPNCRASNDGQGTLAMFIAVKGAYGFVTLHPRGVDMLLFNQCPKAVCNLADLQVMQQAAPEYRHLLLLLLAVQSQLWFYHKVPYPQQQQPNAAQQLWVALGYSTELLLTAISALNDCIEDVCSDTTGAVASRAASHPNKLMQALGESLASSAEGPVRYVPSPGQLPWQQILPDLQQMMLLLKVAKQLYLNGPIGVQGGLKLLLKAASCVHHYSVLALKVQATASEHSPDSVELEVIRLLLQFLQYSKAATVQQAGPASEGCNGSSAKDSVIDLHSALQQAVLGVIQHNPCFNDLSRGDMHQHPMGLTWSHHITQILEGCLREAAGAAIMSSISWSELHDVVGGSVHTWLRWLLSNRASTSVKQPVRLAADHDQAAAADSARPTHIAQPGVRTESFIPSVASSSNGSTAAAAIVHPESWAAVTGCSPLELQVLSLMTSLCKVMTQTVQITPTITVSLGRTQSLAAFLTLAAAGLCEYHTQQSQPPLQQPAVRLWLSLLGRCMVMMGQRLKVLQQELSTAQVLRQQEQLLSHRSDEQRRQMMIKMQALSQERQLKLLQQTTQRYTDEVANLRSQLTAAKSQASSQKLIKTLGKKLSASMDSLQAAAKSKEELQGKVQQAKKHLQQLQEESGTTAAQLRLCEHVNSTTPQQVLAGLQETLAALCSVGVRLTTWSAQKQQQQQQSAHLQPNSSGTDPLGSLLHKRLLQQLLPRLLVVTGACCMLTTDKQAVEHIDEDAETDSAAGDAVAKHLVAVVEEVAGMKLMQNMETPEGLRTGETVEAVFNTAQYAAAHCMTDMLKAEPIRRKVNAQHFMRLDIMLPAVLASKPYKQLHEQLVAIGSELITALHHCWCCNNPGCDNLSADSELQLISGKQRICAGCTGGSTDKDIHSTAARYCSVECQKQHWKQHKTVCRKLHKQWRQQEGLREAA